MHPSPGMVQTRVLRGAAGYIPLAFGLLLDGFVCNYEPGRPATCRPGVLVRHTALVGLGRPYNAPHIRRRHSRGPYPLPAHVKEHRAGRPCCKGARDAGC
eukprot:366007-Chlamydomonas_euryale.AAC.13